MFFGFLVPILVGMGSFLDVVCSHSSVTKTIRGVSYLGNMDKMEVITTYTFLQFKMKEIAPYFLVVNPPSPVVKLFKLSPS